MYGCMLGCMYRVVLLWTHLTEEGRWCTGWCKCIYQNNQWPVCLLQGIPGGQRSVSLRWIQGEVWKTHQKERLQWGTLGDWEQPYSDAWGLWGACQRLGASFWLHTGCYQWFVYVCLLYGNVNLIGYIYRNNFFKMALRLESFIGYNNKKVLEESLSSWTLNTSS